MKRWLLSGLIFATSPAMAQGMDHSMPAMGAQPGPSARNGATASAAPSREHADHQAAPETSAQSGEQSPEPVGTDQSPGSAEPPPIAHGRPADRYYDPGQMAQAEAALMGEHGSASYSQLSFNLAEYQIRNDKDGYRWDGEAWFGDLNRFIVRSQGEGTFGEKIDSAEVQALYSHALDPWWNLQVGVRQDFEPGPARTYATVGIEGRAPYQFDLLATAFLSDKGQLRGRLEGFYDQRITQRLIFQPRLELNLSASDTPAQRLGPGLNDAELGLRLRYEIRREFAPYVGISWTWLGGRTADYARADGRDTTERAVVAGVRIWF